MILIWKESRYGSQTSPWIFQDTDLGGLIMPEYGWWLN